MRKCPLEPPNGLPISCRERAADHPQKTNDLAREAVSCIGVLAADYNGIVLDRRMVSIRRAASAARIAS
jgi:hypothetical protein